MQDLDKSTLWKDVLESVKVTVSPAIYSTWFSQTFISEINESGNRYSAEIGCRSSFVKSTVETRYYGLIQDALSKSLQKPCDIYFVIKNIPEESGIENKFSPLFESEKNVSDESFLEQLLKFGIRPSFNFDNYAVSSSNQMAWAASEAVSKNPGGAYNPLFIWGGVGVGKTHLMNAIGYEFVKTNPDDKIISCTGEHFTNDIVEGIRNKTTQNFRNKYRRARALLVDDIQFIAGKDAVQEEFFHTFNALVNTGSQVVLTSDRPPSEISKLEERLRSRFEAGLIVDVSPPDFELRCAITQIKAKEKGIDIDMEMVQLIAGNLESARKIEGILVRLNTEIHLKKLPITKDLVENIIGKGTDPANGYIIKKTPFEIVEVITKYYSLGKKVLMGSSRTRTIARPRQILMYLLRTQLGLPLEEVGKIVGGRDHTTVMHAVDKITSLASTNVQIRQDIQGIKNML
ncbi:chromosomal replication initiator protein DnaA [Candidatus Woesebacteria bacterium RIFCSPHIGHO2_01_FULL_37_10]|uniref:Chromosomal replication initiator protein DnaA n=1 Tax=Candidatus Woesebacteria bacterium RIFCSPHIGHO2_01_FULL_37_10 TaxID=1802489 RepID=A0A1F7XW03_9BACT|nr:MAG: chromosomal replication initiator protein DnaA [Candidatus Woesebacteria bacterium RIFCSPHIGHO2_01_FULL_37_10]